MILCGLLEAPLVCGPLVLAPGPVALWLTFAGGERPVVLRVEVRGEVREGETTHHVVSYEAGGAVSLVALLNGLVDALSDVSVDAEALPLADVVLSFSSGVELVVPGDHPLRVSGATDGPPDAPCLSRALEVGIGGGGLRVSHKSLRWLASTVPVSVATARLFPDGRVELEGARGRLARLVQGGLDVASEQLTDLVRTAPAFERVRTFLRS